MPCGVKLIYSDGEVVFEGGKFETKDEAEKAAHIYCFCIMEGNDELKKQGEPYYSGTVTYEIFEMERNKNMKKESEEIKKFLRESGKDASAMTQGLKKIGNGSMEKGIDTVAEYFQNSGRNQGIIWGAVGATNILALCGLAWLVGRRLDSDNKQQREKGEMIARKLQETIDEYNLAQLNSSDDLQEEEGERK